MLTALLRQILLTRNTMLATGELHLLVLHINGVACNIKFIGISLVKCKYWARVIVMVVIFVRIVKIVGVS